MGILKEELFVELATNKEHPKHRQFVEDLKNCIFTINWSETSIARERGSWFSGYRYVDEFDFTVDREAALKAYSKALEMVKARGCLNGKGMRPYYYEDQSTLDRNQPWWGFEFETGYAKQEDMANALEYAWNIAEGGVSFDHEGESAYPSEVTFAPIEMSRVLDGTAPACKFIKYLSDNNLGHSQGSAWIGTHFNFSLPNITGWYEAAEYVINNTLHKLSGDRETYFGRRNIYGGAQSRNDWVEIKLFRTTYDYKQFMYYVDVCHALTRVAAGAEAGNLSSRHYCSNFEEMIGHPEVKPQYEQDSSLTGSSEGPYVSGEHGYYYSSDNYDDDYDDDEEF